MTMSAEEYISMQYAGVNSNDMLDAFGSEEIPHHNSLNKTHTSAKAHIPAKTNTGEKKMSIDFSKLAEPFPAEDIEWRVQSSGKKGNKIWAKVLAYVTNRAIMERLDTVCGPQNWKNYFEKAPDGGVMCGIAIKCGEEWVTKWDGAPNTQIESVKGGLSGSMKRAGSQWQIGRYLYKLDANWAIVKEGGSHSDKLKDGTWFNWDPPQLPKWAIPEGDTSKPRATQDDSNEPELETHDSKHKTIDDYMEDLDLIAFREDAIAWKQSVFGEIQNNPNMGQGEKAKLTRQYNQVLEVLPPKHYTGDDAPTYSGDIDE